MNVHQRAVTELKMELRNFSDSLVITNFRALSSGVGIGDTKRRVIPTPTMQIPSVQKFQGAEINIAVATPVQDAAAVAMPAPAPAQRKDSTQKDGREQPEAIVARKVKYRVLRFFLGHFIDLIFSVIAVACMISIASMATQSVGVFSALQLARDWLRELRLIEFVAILYATFTLYFVIFSLFVGGTIGRQITYGSSMKPRGK